MTNDDTIDVASAAKTIRDFLRANARAEGALDAMDALHSLESAAATSGEIVAREAAYSQAIHDAQREARAAFKDKAVGDRYMVADTEQLIQIAREALAEYGLTIEPGDAEVLLVGGQPFLRCHYGTRHVRGFTKASYADWPVDVRGGGMAAANAMRGVRTTALGYHIRDLLLLERRKDESESGQAGALQPRSGPQRRTQGRAPPKSSSPPAKAPPKAAPNPKAEPIGERAAAVIARIAAADSDALDKAEHFVADMQAVAGEPDAPHTSAEVAAMDAAITSRRQAITGKLYG